MVRNQGLKEEVTLLKFLFANHPKKEVFKLLRKLGWEKAYYGSFRDVWMGPKVVVKFPQDWTTRKNRTTNGERIVSDSLMKWAKQHSHIEVSNTRDIKKTPLGKYVADILAYDRKTGMIIQEYVGPACHDATCNPSRRIAKLLQTYGDASVIQMDWSSNHSHVGRSVKIFDLG